MPEPLSEWRRSILTAAGVALRQLAILLMETMHVSEATAYDNLAEVCRTGAEAARAAHAKEN